MLRELLRVLGDVRAEIIVVDDESSDGTDQEVRAVEAQDARVRLLRREGARGLASAAIAGWEHARGAVLGIMDGDGQHDPVVTMRLLEQVRGGADLAVASRYREAGPSGLTGGRDLISRAGTRLVDVALGVRLTDPLSGQFLMRRAWFEAAAPEASAVGFKILADLVASSPAHPRIAETPTALRARLAGESKLDLRVVVDLAAMVVEKRTRGLLPARFVLFSAVGVSGVAVQVAALKAFDLLIPQFALALVPAILTAMTWNFALNNVLTFRDRRLRGFALITGWISFAIACGLGAFANWAIASALQRLGAWDTAAAIAGALAGGVWNFLAARRATWGVDRRPRQSET